jgi:hypothetical protein
MGRRRHLLGAHGSSFIVLLASSILVLPLPASITDSKLCDELDRSLNLCPKTSAQARDDSVEVRASTPGSPGTRNDSGGANGGARDAGPGETTRQDPPLWRLDPNKVIPPGRFADGTEFENAPAPMIREPWQIIAPPTADVDAIVTVDDIVDFRPAAAELRMEPDGWTVTGLDTNFWIGVTTNTQSGELLGRSAAVRFTPASYRFNYGDSTSATHTTAGATWTNQSVAEFEPTPTSHIFNVAGSYTVSATVEYTAEYQFDGDIWMPVRGTVRTATNSLTVVAARASTVLVNNDCATAPTGAGC